MFRCAPTHVSAFANLFTWDERVYFSITDVDLLRRYKQLRLSATLIEYEFKDHPRFVSLQLVGQGQLHHMSSLPLHPQSWLITCIHEAPKGAELPSGHIPTVCENLPILVQILTDARVETVLQGQGKEQEQEQEQDICIQDPQSAAHFLLTSTGELQYNQLIYSVNVTVANNTAYVDGHVKCVPNRHVQCVQLTTCPFPRNVTHIVTHFYREL
jgi:prepilin-type processing-associated H-X9-DG protein